MTDTGVRPGMREAIRFLVYLDRIDRSGLQGRDIIVLYWIMTHPGKSGFDLCRGIGYEHRSAVQYQTARLLAKGFIVDRREIKAGGSPNRFFATDKGRKYWDDLLDIIREGI